MLALSIRVDLIFKMERKKEKTTRKVSKLAKLKIMKVAFAAG